MLQTTEINPKPPVHPMRFPARPLWVKGLFAAILGCLGLLQPQSPAQGPLAPPPGPIQPGMQSLEDIDARIQSIRDSLQERATPIESLPYIVTEPGRYILTESMDYDGTAAAIRVQSSNVVIDLNGHTLRGIGEDNRRAVEVFSGNHHVTIMNGIIREFNFQGIFAQSSRHVSLLDLNVDHNGSSGATLSSYALIANCTFTTNGDAGVETQFAVVTRVVANGNEGIGISNNAGKTSNSVATGNNSHGISANDGIVEGCVSRNNDGWGILASSGVINQSLATNNEEGNIFVSTGESFHNHTDD